jgi:hypothetical protein
MLQKALRRLPKTLDETYARILTDNIPPGCLPYTIRILQFLTFSERPLRIEEAVDAIAVDQTERPRFHTRNRMPVPREISRCCSSLIAIVQRPIKDSREYSDDNTGDTITEIQLSHFSVKEWLVSGRLKTNISAAFNETAARAAIAVVCLAYLLELNLRVRELRQSYPFAEYAARYWAEHAAIGEETEEAVTDMAMELFSSQARFRTSLQLQPSSSTAEPTLHFAARQGLFHSSQQLTKRGADVNAQGGHYGHALEAASYRGHEGIVQLLLEKGADVNAQGGLYGHALEAASYGGHEEIVQLLLEKGAARRILWQSGHKRKLSGSIVR